MGQTATANGSSDGNLAATYALIYSFLSSRSHEKAAAAVKKAVKDIVVLKDNVTVGGTSLDEIVKWWRAKQEADAKKESQSDSDSDSDSDSSSKSTSSDDSSNSDTSSTSGSSSDSSGRQTSLKSQKAAKAANANGQAIASRTVVSNHKTGSGTLSDKDPKKSNDSISRKTGKTTKSISSSNSSATDSSDSDSSDSDSSDSDSSASDSNSSVAAPAKASQITTHLPKTGTAVILPPLDSTIARVTKKRRISESGNAVATAIVTETSSSTPNQNGKPTGNKPRKSNTPFQRIKADAVEFHDERLKDNAFVARGASANDYGARANQDLIVTRGDGFRKEKNKKKRGSYRGGEITMESHSIKFT